MNKVFALLVVFTMLGGLVAGCAAPTPTPTPAPPTAVPTKAPAAAPTQVPAPTAAPAAAGGKQVALNFWHMYTGSRAKLMDELIASFNASHPNIVIKATYAGNTLTMHDKLITALVGGAPADVAQLDQFWSAELADGKALIKVGDLMKNDTTIKKDDFYPQIWDTATYNGEIWSMPFSFSNIALYYNKKLFKAAGLDPETPPATWDDLVKYGQKLTLDTNNDGKTDQWGLNMALQAAVGNIYYWLAFLWQNNGQLFSADYSTSKFNEQPGVEAAQFWVDLVQKHKIVPLAAPDKGFANGLVAMEFASTSSLADYRTMLKDDLGMGPMPKGKKAATGVGGGNLGIFTKCADVNAAWEFIKWMVSTETNLKWSTASGYVPLRPAVVASADYQAYLTKEPLGKVILAQMSTGVVRPNVPAYANASQEIGQAVEQAVFGNKDPKPLLDAAAVKVNGMLKK